ncbi:methionyl-tRNA formyltransferase, mitochondrial isoform X1 [Bombus pyrosoma]|uniref:methionyl-tRNA formyltransferase, mitochondrial isoform X1 n=1 Tax=Bombus pyrosoma TaxID=396416 RepID=UPI001CB98E3D|nr:methionyl-tRNA formyltransferase, mitochondrial isoform X1 [Bombus pyrosoma]
MYLIFNRAVYNIAPFLYSLKEVNKIFFLTFNSKIYNKHYTCYSQSHEKQQSGAWKVLFFGTDEFAVESLKVLYNKYRSKELERLEIVTVNQKKENSVTKYAKENKIIVNKWPVEINKSEFHIGIVVSFGHLIPSKIINAFPLGMLNVHSSLLPRWRGAAPIIHALINGDSKTGVTIMKIMPKKFDIGEIILQKAIDIDEHETLPELYTKLAKLGANLLKETFENLFELLKSARPQDEENVTYAPKITSKISLVNWNKMSATNVYNLHRALVGLYPLTTSFQNAKIKLFDVHKIESESIVTELERAEPGTVIYSKNNNALIIKCKENTFVSAKQITIQGKRTMSALNFCNGYISGRNRTKILFTSM